MTEGGPGIRVVLPRALQEYAGGAETVEVPGDTLAHVLAEIDRRFPGLRDRVLDDQGRLRRFVHVFVNGDSVGLHEPHAVSLRPGDTVHLLPSVAGGVHGRDS